MKKLLEHIKKQQEARAEEQAKLEAQKQKNILEAKRILEMEEQAIRDRKEKKKEAAEEKRKKHAIEQWDQKISEGLKLIQEQLTEQREKTSTLNTLLEKEQERRKEILETQRKKKTALRIAKNLKEKVEKDKREIINKLLEKRTPVPEILPWRKWVDIPTNKAIFLVDKVLAEELFYDDRDEVLRKRTRGKNKPPPPWTPNSISGLRVWMDADYGSSITLNGSKVTQWASRVDDPDKPNTNWGGRQSNLSNAPSYTFHNSGKRTIQFNDDNSEYLNAGNSNVDSDGWRFNLDYPAFTFFLHGNMTDTSNNNTIFDVQHPRSEFSYESSDQSYNIYRSPYVFDTFVGKTGEQIWTFSNVQSPQHIPTYTLTRETTNVQILDTGSADLSVQTHTQYQDDVDFQINLSGTFTFEGVAYTSTFVNSNGFITLGAAHAAGGEFINASLDDSDTDVVIAPWWDDLVVDTDKVQAHYFASSKYWIFQWHGRRYAHPTGSLDPRTSVKMQAVVYMDDHTSKPGTVEFRYGEANVTGTVSTNASIGVKGVTNIFNTSSVNNNYMNWRDFLANTNRPDGLTTLNTVAESWPATQDVPYYFRFSPTIQEDKHKTKIFSDGELIASGFRTQPVILNDYYTTNKNQTIGIQFNLADGFEGNMNEIVVYNRILTDDERAKVETYLADKWGTTVATRSVG